MIESIGVPNPSFEDLSGVIGAFLEASAQHFSTAIRPSQFFRRLENIWGLTFEGHEVEIKTTDQVRWSPTRISVSTGRFTIEWSIQQLDPTIRIPSGFILDEPEFGVPPTPGHDDAYPDSDDAPASPGQRASYRRKVREARLRVASAQLHAEKLAEIYYRKYGPHLLDESDSSLSE